ncbi:hypothetical protein IQ06DRAFT_346212 [Phaeosphaeriaceae sp. SRC1lsM3a]|nr:hypothetical protein IQ06DRAFT_346212 [Stagonospora sp. SRC1lsM3a]
MSSSASDCKVGSGTPGGFYWCYGKNFDTLGSDAGCEWRPSLHTCYSFSYARTCVSPFGPMRARTAYVCILPITHTKQALIIGFNLVYGGLECTGKVSTLWINGEPHYTLECPGAIEMQGILGMGMKCYGLWVPIDPPSN